MCLLLLLLSLLGLLLGTWAAATAWGVGVGVGVAHAQQQRCRQRRRRLNARLVSSVIFVLEAAANEDISSSRPYGQQGRLLLRFSSSTSSSHRRHRYQHHRPRRRRPRRCRLFWLKCVIDVKSGNKLFFICACFQFV